MLPAVRFTALASGVCEAGGYLVELSEVPDADVALVQFVHAFADDGLHEIEEAVDLGGGAVPVLGGEGEERHELDAGGVERLEDTLEIVGARPVTGEARQPPLARAHRPLPSMMMAICLGAPGSA